MKTICDKKNLRKFALEKRAQFGYEKSSQIVSKILNSKEFNTAKNIALYYPYKNEIDISSLLNFKGKNFYLPRCCDDLLEFAKYNGPHSLARGAFGIMEPKEDKINPEILDVIYIPALMANKKGYRLGYGKGFYDRFFSQNKINALKVIVVAKELISDEFVEDSFDYKCDRIISA